MKHWYFSARATFNYGRCRWRCLYQAHASSAAGAILESTPLYVLSRWKTNISQLESPLKLWQVQMKVSLPKLVLVSAAGDDMIVVISINATEEGGKCQKNQRLLS